MKEFIYEIIWLMICFAAFFAGKISERQKHISTNIPSEKENMKTICDFCHQEYISSKEDVETGMSKCPICSTTPTGADSEGEKE